MDFIGIDVHKKQSQICVMNEQGEVTYEIRIPTDRPNLSDILRSYQGARVLMEASTESEWVARHLETLGLEVIVADPNFAPMYATRSRKVKTDKRDARCLAQACKLGAYRPAHRLSDDRRRIRAQLEIREALLRTRTRYINLIGALLRGQGYHVADGGAEAFARRVENLQIPAELRAELGPLLEMLGPLNTQLDAMEGALSERAKKDTQAQVLMSMPSVGPITALAFLATLDQATRFQSAHQVEAYLAPVAKQVDRLRDLERRGGWCSSTPRGRSRVEDGRWRAACRSPFDRLDSCSHRGWLVLSDRRGSW
jgi:transposase